MLRFVTKEEYWKIEDSGILKSLPQKFSWHLKSIQDAVAFQYLYQLSNQTIAEVGGGDSRILPILSKKNTCYNVDEFQGANNGPKQSVVIEGVKNVSTLLGEFSELLPSAYFDYVFSISVVEHVLTQDLTNFFKDCHRVLKPNGNMIHLIDVYLEDSLKRNQDSLAERLRKYKYPFQKNMFMPLNSEDIVISEEELCFSTRFATNPDNMMNNWNKLAPGLKNKRIKSQSCSLLMAGSKI